MEKLFSERFKTHAEIPGASVFGGVPFTVEFVVSSMSIPGLKPDASMKEIVEALNQAAVDGKAIPLEARIIGVSATLAGHGDSMEG